MSEEAAGFSLQPGFVEGIVADGKRFGTLEEAYRHIFRRNQEYAVLLWNAIPVRLSYQEDLPALILDLLGLLESIQEARSEPAAMYVLRAPNLQTAWQVDVDADTVTIDADWQRMPGDYQAAFERLSTIRVPRTAFLCEWKLLLEQLTRAFDDSEAVLPDRTARRQLTRLRKLVDKIPSRGRFYRPA